MLLVFLKILHLAITSQYVVQILFFLRKLDRCHKNMMNWNKKKTQSNRLLKQEVLSMNIINIYSLYLDTFWGTI